MAGKRSEAWLEEFADPEDLLSPLRTDNINERKLWCAVLKNAVDDSRGDPVGDSTGGDESEHSKRIRILCAKAWIAYEGREPGTFRWVLDVLGLVGYTTVIRRALL